MPNPTPETPVSLAPTSEPAATVGEVIVIDGSNQRVVDVQEKPQVDGSTVTVVTTEPAADGM